MHGEKGRFTMNRVSAAVVTVASVVALLSGCSGAGNDGGDTTCQEFLAKTTNDKDATVAKMLKERNGRNASTSDVESKRAALNGSCQPADKQNAKISDVA